MDGVGIITTNIRGHFGREVRLYQHLSEGYGTGEYYVDHLTKHHLIALRDWMITLPEDLYAPLESVHRSLERMNLESRVI